MIQELQERSDSDASVLLSRNVPLEHDASLPQSSSEQQTVPQRVAPPTELSRDSGMGTINSVQSGPQQVTAQARPTDGQNDSQISVQSAAEPSDADRGRKRCKDITSKQERTKKQRRWRENSSSLSDSSVEEVRRKHHPDKMKSHQKRRHSRERSVLRR